MTETKIKFWDRQRGFMRSIPRDLPAAAKHTLCALFLYAHADGGGIWVSITELAEDTGEPIRNVKRALKLLIERGYLTHEGWKTVGTNTTVRQRKIDLDALARDRAKEAWANGGTSAISGKALGPSVVSASATSGPQTIQNSPLELATKESCSKPAQASLLPEAKPAEGKPRPAAKKPKAEPPEGFEVWWAAYPHKVDKQDAAVEYAKALAEGIKPAVLLAALKAYPFSDEKHFQIHPKRWLSKRRWEATTVAPLPPPGQPWIPPRAGTAATQFTGHPWPTRPPRPGMRWIWATASYRQAREDGWCEISNDTH